MGIFDIFRRKKVGAGKKMSVSNVPMQYRMALQFNEEFATLLTVDKYIARSDYKHLISLYQDEYQFFESVVNANILEEYINKNKLDILQIRLFLDYYKQIKFLPKDSKIIRNHNDQFVASHIKSEREYLDNILTN